MDEINIAKLIEHIKENVDIQDQWCGDKCEYQGRGGWCSLTQTDIKYNNQDCRYHRDPKCKEIFN